MPLAQPHLRSGLLALVMLLAAGLSPAFCASPIDAAMKSVVRVRTLERSGAGFLAKHSGLAVTSLSLIQGAKAATVECSDGEVLSVIGVLGADAQSDLVVLRLSDLSECPSLRIADDIGDLDGRVWALALPDNTGQLSHESRVGNLLSFSDKNGAKQTTTDSDGPRAGHNLLELKDPPSLRYAGGPVIDENGAVVGVVSGGSARPVDRGMAPYAVPCSKLRSLLGELFPKPIPLAELVEARGHWPPNEADAPSSTAIATKAYWNGMSRVMGNHVIAHHKWCVRNGFRASVANLADRRADKYEKRIAEEGESRDRVRLRGLGFGPLEIMVIEANAKSSAESQQVNRSLAEVAGLQKSTSQALAALNTEGVSAELVRFVGQLGQAFREAGEHTETFVDQQSTSDRTSSFETDDRVSTLRRKLESLSTLQNVDGPRLREKLAADYSSDFGPLVLLTPDEQKLVSGEAAEEARRQVAIEADAAKLWAHYERARDNGGGEKTLRHIIEKFPGSASAERAQRLLNKMGTP